MAGPHPTVAAARTRLRELLKEAGVSPGDRLLVACSGGSDSMALAQAALFVAARDGYIVDTLTVDHGLREESAREAAAVARTLREMGARRAETVRVSLGVGAGPEAEARSARYAALAAAAAGEYVTVSDDGAQPAGESGGATHGAATAAGRSDRAATVLLGHTADDQAETVLLGLARGSGARSIRGMAPVGPLPEHGAVRALRPLLDLRREDLREGLRSAHITWVDDPTNEPTSPWRAHDGTMLRRAAVRHRSLPVLEEDLGPGIVEALARTAKLLQADEEALEGWACRELERLAMSCDTGVAISELRALPVAVRTRVLRTLALRAGARGGELVGWHVDHLDELVTGPGGGRGIDLPGVRAMQREGRIVFDSVGLRHHRRKDSDGRS
ncbi:tRNA lysidine(34) synthetase [Actinomycetaceae bacterium L2_0104]